MAGKYHVRSISLPSRSHPTTLRIEDELNRLKTWEASLLSTSESICAGLSGLEDLYQCMDDLLNMASTQQVLCLHQHEQCIDELLDRSVRLLDICSIARDYMFQLKEHVHALQSALRRRKGDSSIENNIINYTCFRKEMKKQGKKLITELKQMDNKLGAAPLLDQDHHFSAVIRVLREVNVMNTSIFQYLFSFLSAPVSSKQTRWSLVSKLMHKGVISCEEKQENVNELESVDAALRRHTSDVEKMKIAHKRLVALESSIEGLENRLECVFRHLIKARTSLLNVISQ
ncbi:uncharacterized protein LOC110410035 [Herrania umbratica]|uniref:Uncharacterized protein LOC110410035 n=1 Tax=Herrania umbratica TaxID=108875 RepID=A0A6J0ZLY7_9ROSI|nr:uncharacterized protein LOC110410035 [Herrania umbratica]